MIISFSQTALKRLKKLDPITRKRLKQKLKWFLAQENPLKFAHFLKDSEIGKYRYRIGSYRVAFDLEDGRIKVMDVGHRREIYK